MAYSTDSFSMRDQNFDDDIDIFDFTKPLEKIYLPGGQTEGHVVPNDSELVEEIEERPKLGQEYAETYRRKELEQLRKGQYEEERQRSSLYGHSSTLGDIEITSAGTFPDINELNKEELTDVYDEYYKRKRKIQPNLLINKYRRQILSSIQSNEVTIIKGYTGCGKTTQVPQYILDSFAEKRQHCNIVVTQPRRIAAISIAERVCKERDWPVGTLCGFQVGQKDNTTEDTRLTYMTVGVFLNQIVNAKDLNRYTHIILDEVHERNLDTDFALLVVKKLLNTNSRNVKIILMSATVDPAKFSVYFQRVVAGKFVKAPVLSIVDTVKTSTYDVQVFYLDDLETLGELPKPDFDDPCISEEAYNICVKLIKQFEKIDKETKNKQSVLVFLPGINEIEELHKKLSDPKVHSPNDSMKYLWLPLPLHSTITHQEQAEVFKPAPTGYRKVILSTNISESSITVPDIGYVIDFCLTKVLVTDPVSNFTSLQLAWTSKDNCDQRKGRVGRVMSGRVYRMVPKRFYDSYLEQEAVPDMLRCPLEKVVLQSKMLQMGEPKAILALALDPPNLSDIERTILILKEAGGLLLTCDGMFTPHDGDLTYLGLLMAQLPLDIRLTRLIVMGYIFSVLPECIVMACSMSLKSVFSNPFKEKMKAYNAKLEWADTSCSDSIAFLNVFKVYKENLDEGYFQRSVGDSEEQWAKRHFIQIRQLREVYNLVGEVTRRLKVNQIEEGPTPNGSPITYNEFEKALILKLVIAGAFYPHYFGRGGRGGQIDEPSAVKTLAGRDPFNTIYFNGYPPEQPPHLYSESIRQELKDCKEDMRITHDGSCKVYVEFRRSDNPCDSEYNFDDRVPGKVSMAVYRAVKLRQIRRHLEIRIMRPEDAKNRAAKLGISKSREMYLKELRTDDGDEDDMDDTASVSSVATTVRKFGSNIPGIDVSALHIHISHFIDAGHFWACHADHQSETIQTKVFEKLNSPYAKLRPFTKEPELGDLCVAPWSEAVGVPPKKYRARIEAICDRKVKEVKVFFVDYGNTSVVGVQQLQDYTDELYVELSKYPMQAFECVLSKVAPSIVRSSRNGAWSKEANDYFRSLTQNNPNLFGHIFSVVNGVVSLELKMIRRDKNKDKNEKPEQQSINELLIQKNFAEPVEESFLSKANHEIRMQRQMDSEARTVYNQLQGQENWSENKYDPPDRRDCKLTLQLRGPISPLEMKIFSYTRGALCKDVRVAQDSVNSVLLDSDPQDPHERLIVAAHVSQNQASTALILHQTTMMPNIHGLAALIPFIFAPKIELRVNDTKTRYIGLICGLGVDQDGRPMFPEHDMEIPFDVEFTFEDLKNVNRLRYLMGSLLNTEENEKYPSLHWSDIVKLQKNTKKIVLELLCERRKSQEIQYSKKQHMWGLAEANCYIQNKNIVESNKRSIFPFHPGIQIRPESDEVARLRNHNEELNRLARAGVEKYTKIECELCNVTLSTIAALRIHLNTTQHRNQELALLDEQMCE